MLDLTPLAAWAVAALAPYLATAAGKAAESLGESAAGALFAKLREKFATRPAAAEALEDLQRAPDDADAQAALRVALKKALAADPELAAWLAAARDAAPDGTTQTLSQTGDGNKSVQNSGDNSQISIG